MSRIDEIETIDDRLTRLLDGVSYQHLSNISIRYNCVGWATGNMKWWDDERGSNHYWPPGVPRSRSIEHLVQALSAEGFFVCDTSDYENDTDKIALYELDGEWSHAARVCEDGTHWSKLCFFEDAKHEPLQVSSQWGKIVLYMKRSPSQWQDS